MICEELVQTVTEELQYKTNQCYDHVLDITTYMGPLLQTNVLKYYCLIRDKKELILLNFTT